MVLVGVELETLVFELDAQTTRPCKCSELYNIMTQLYDLCTKWSFKTVKIIRFVGKLAKMLQKSVVFTTSLHAVIPARSNFTTFE